MARIVENESDLKGITFGEDWVYAGWPDPPADDDFEKWAKADEEARAEFEKFKAYADKEAAKNAEKDKANNGRENK